MKIAIVGDVHYAPVPENRIDDYINTCLNKIEQVARECNHVIFLGDIFSTPKVDEKYLNPLMNKLATLKYDLGVNFYTIIGNHDVYNELESRINESSLGSLESARLINIIYPDKPITLKDEIGQNLRFNTVPVRFRDAIQYVQNKRYEQNDILLIHHEYETGTNRFTYDDLRNLGCRHVFFGHDHCPLPEGRIIYPELTVYRCGSLMRNIAQDYNFVRQIYYFIIDTTSDRWIYCKNIEQQPANIIFKEEKYIRQDYNRKQFSEAMNNYIEKYKQKIIDHQNGKQSKNKLLMSEVLSNLKTPDYDIDLIKKKYEIIGEKFE